MLAHLGRSAFVIELPGCRFRRLTIELGDEGLPSLPVAVDAYRRTDVCGRGQLACVIWATALDTQTLSHNETAEKKGVALTCQQIIVDSRLVRFGLLVRKGMTERNLSSRLQMGLGETKRND